MAAAVATPLEKQFSTIAGIDNMTSSSSLGSTVDHTAVLARPRHRRRRAGRSSRDREDAAPAPAGHQPAVISEVESGRVADSLLRAHIADALVAAARRDRRDDDRAAAVDDRRRRAGPGVRRGEVRRARAARSHGARLSQDRHRRSRDGDQRSERQPADRCALGAEDRVHAAGERAAQQRGAVPHRSA